MDSPPSILRGSIVTLCEYPPGSTIEDIANEFQQFGDLTGIGFNPQTESFDIEFSSPRQAAMAHNYLMTPYLAQAAQEAAQAMMPSANMMPTVMHPMMGAMMAPMMQMMNPMMSMMNNPMMNNPMMNNPMMGMAKTSPVQRNRIASRSGLTNPNFTTPSPSKIAITTSADGCRKISSTPQNELKTVGALSTEDKTVGGQSPEDIDTGVIVEVGPCTLCLTRTSYTCGRCGSFYCSRDCQKKNWPDHQNKCNSGLPPLNYAGKKHITEIEIVQYDHENGRTSPAVNARGRSENQQSGRVRSPQIVPASERTMNVRRTPESNREESGSRRQGLNETRSSSMNMNGANSRPGRNETNGNDFRTGRNENQNGYKSDRQDTSAGRKPYNDNARSPRNVSRDSSEIHSPRNINEQAQVQVSPSVMVAPKPKACETVASKESESPKKFCVSDRLKNLSVSPSTFVKSAGMVQTGSPPISPPDARVDIPPCVLISNGDQVAISHFENNVVYLRSNTPQALEQMVKMTKELAEHCNLAEPLERNPKKKEFLAAKYKLDDTYYRAAVVNKPNKSESKYDVLFVDFGNIESGVPVGHMIPLTDSLAKVPLLCSKTSLKNIPDSKLTPEAKELLNSYFVGELPLIVEFSGKFEDGVTLVDQKSGESLNEKILAALRIAETPAVLQSPGTAPAAVVSRVSAAASLRAALAPSKTTTAPVAAPTPAPVPVAAPTPAPVPVAAPTPAPVPVAAPTPAPVPVAPPTPAPVPVAVPTPPPVPVAAPTPAPVPVAAPTPVPAPVAAPTPVPAPVVAPTPAPVPVAAPTSAPVPVAAPTPVPAPVAAPTPVPAPVVAPALASGSCAPASAPKKIFLDDIKSVEFPSKGTELDVLINSIVEEHGFLMACPLNIEAIEEASNLMEKLEAHANCSQSYRPSENELCIAQWSDECWYRAVVLCPEDNDKFNVMFLEYGNIDSIPLANIRPFKEEFLKVPALSSMCILSGPDLNDEQKKKLKAMQQDQWIVKATVMDIAEGPIITLNIPEIREKL